MNTRANERKRALVTGGRGFLGRHLLTALCRENWDVVVLLRKHAPLDNDRAHDDALHDNSLPEANLQAHDGVSVLYHDGSTEQMVELLSNTNAHVVFHLAATFVAEHSVRDVESLVRDNVLLGTQLLEGMHRNGLTSLVATGSAWQHYANRDYSPVSLYAASKQAFESMAAWYAEVGQMRIVLPHLADVYGAHDPRPKLLGALERAERNGEMLHMNDGSPFIDLLHVQDAVSALLVSAERAMHNEPGLERWAVRAGQPQRVRDVVALWERVRQVKLNVQWNVRPLRARETMTEWSAGDLLPAWNARVALEQGISQL